MTADLSGVLDRLAVTISDSTGLEELVRPFLDILEDVTGLESTYLTRIDEAESLQHIVFSHNTKTQRLNIPEGLSVDWADTLCKRALDEQIPFSDDVANCWGDSQAARELGISTYLSEPVRVGEGELFGTLCGASGSRVLVTAEARRLLSMLAKLIARQIERDRLLERLQKENLAYSQQALTDPLTGIPNRRALMQELARALAGARRAAAPLQLAFIDLDGFKKINDRYGHDAGDRFLMQFAQKLTGGLRGSDFVARHGGDEFVVFGPGAGAELDDCREAVLKRLEEITTGTYRLVDEDIYYAGPSIGVVTSLPGEADPAEFIARADAVMYRVKKSRGADR